VTKRVNGVTAIHSEYNTADLWLWLRLWFRGLNRRINFYQGWEGYTVHRPK